MVIFDTDNNEVVTINLREITAIRRLRANKIMFKMTNGIEYRFRIGDKND